MRLKNRMKKVNKSRLALIGMSFLLVTLTACSTIRLQRAQFTEDKRSKLPQNIKTADEDADLVKETSCIITVDEDGTLQVGKEQVSEENLKDKIIEKMKNKPPDKRIVYIESAVGVQYQKIVSLFYSIRRADIDKAGLVAYKKNYEKLGRMPGRIEIRIPSEPEEDDLNVRPNPLTLFVTIDKNGSLLLNNSSMGSVADPAALIDKLNEVFKEREAIGVFREGTNEVEKTVIIKSSLSLKYGDVIKVIDAVKLAGAEPINMQVDDLSN